MARLGNTAFATSVALLALRLTLGWILIFHGTQNGFGWFGDPGFSAFTDTIAKLPFPSFLPPSAWAALSVASELLGGISLLLGLLTRLGSLPVIFHMLIGIATVHAKNGFSNQAHGYEYNLLIIATAVALLIAGPGIISLDALLFRRGFWAIGPQPLSNPIPRA